MEGSPRASGGLRDPERLGEPELGAPRARPDVRREPALALDPLVEPADQDDGQDVRLGDHIRHEVPRQLRPPGAGHELLDRGLRELPDRQAVPALPPPAGPVGAAVTLSHPQRIALRALPPGPGAPATGGRVSGALRWPVPGPRGVVWLSVRELSALVVCRTAHLLRGRVTTARLAELTGNPSRGQTWNEMARLRQQGLIGFRAYPVMERDGRDRARLGGQRRPSPGSNGRLLVWIPKAARIAYRRAIDDAHRWREAVRIDLTPTRFPGFSGRARAESWWRARLARGGSPPGGPAGPRRGRRPPIAVTAHCPAGHRTTTGRWSWREGPPAWVAEYVGRCRPCGVDVRETLTVELPPEPARPDSPAESADAAVRARRAAIAAEILAEQGRDLPLGQRVRLERDYLSPPRP